jgi:monovalent cation:H+ antiporter-2, CPA2 family
MAATTINIGAYSDALVVLATAGVVVPLVRRWGFSAVLGYLGAGAIMGPLGLGSFIDRFPWLYWVTVVDAKNVAGIAELGVVFLLFLIGLELSYQRLLTMRRLVFGLGSLQVILSTAVIGSVIALAGNETAASIILGACLALSSTAIVIEVLSNRHRPSTTAGRTSFAVLLAQDLAVVPLLLFISILGAGTNRQILTSLLLAFGNAALALGFIVVFGRLLLRPLFRLVASTGKRTQGRQKGYNTPKAEIERQEQIKEAMEYRLIGYTSADRREMNVAPSTAYKWVAEVLAEITQETAEELRRVMFEQCHQIMQKLMPLVDETAPRD